MASVLTKTMTAEEFFDFVHRPENRDRCFELEQGEVVEMSRPGEVHGVVCGNVVGSLWNYTRARKQGYVCPNDTGILLQRDPDTVRGPDVSVYPEARRFVDLERKYSEHLPDLAVEVFSPTDRFGAMVRRINQLLARGVKMVWLVDPDARNVTAFRTGVMPVVVEENEELLGYDVLPDFRCQVGEFLQLPGETA